MTALHLDWSDAEGDRGPANSGNGSTRGTVVFDLSRSYSLHKPTAPELPRGDLTSLTSAIATAEERGAGRHGSW